MASPPRTTARIRWTALAAERDVRRWTEWRARARFPTRSVPLSIPSPTGHTLPARLHLPSGAGPHPAVLFCPGGIDGIGGGEGLSPIVTVQRLARAGIASLIWSPSGREGAPGTEDHNGPIHQAEAGNALAALVAHPDLDATRLAVFSISFGLVLAAGALVARPDLAQRVRALVDWEGPPSKRWFVTSRLKFTPTLASWWAPREATRLISGLPCAYHRFQSRWDHVHGAATGLADEMLDAALSAGLTRVFLNGKDAREPRVLGPFWVAEQGTLLLSTLVDLLDVESGGPGR